VKREIAVIVGLLAVCALASCHTSPPSRFYALRSTEPAGHPTSAVAYSVVVGPITVPAVVDRPQIVAYHGNQVTLAEQSRWAEPLSAGIPRVIAENLANLLVGAQVSAVPQKVSLDPDYRVLLDVQRFEPVLGDAVTIDVLWTVRAAAGGATRSGRSLVHEAAGGGDYGPIVDAFNRSLATVSGDIAAAIRSMASTS
jgi:uncharacterized protein